MEQSRNRFASANSSESRGRFAANCRRLVTQQTDQLRCSLRVAMNGDTMNRGEANAEVFIRQTFSNGPASLLVVNPGQSPNAL